MSGRGHEQEEQPQGFAFPRDRFVLYLKQRGCYGSQTLLAFMKDHPLPMQVVFLDFKSKLKSVPALEDRTTGKMLSLEETKNKIKALARSGMDPQLMQKAFVLYVHPRSATSNELIHFIAEKNLAVDVFDIEFLDYVKGTPCLADMEEEAIYEAEGAIEGYQDMYDEFLARQEEEQDGEGGAATHNGNGGKFHSTNTKMLSFMGKTVDDRDNVQTKKFVTLYDTDKSLKPAPFSTKPASFVSSDASFSGLMRSSHDGDNNVQTTKFKTSFATKAKTIEQLTREREQMRVATQKMFVSSNPRMAFVAGNNRGADDHDMRNFHADIQSGGVSSAQNTQHQGFGLGHSMRALPTNVTTANTSTRAVSNKDVSVLLAKRRALRTPAPSKSQPCQHPSMQHSSQQRGSTSSSSSSSAARSNKSKTVNQKDIIALLARRRAILAR
jgi:histone H3/H4